MGIITFTGSYEPDNTNSTVLPLSPALTTTTQTSSLLSLTAPAPVDDFISVTGTGSMSLLGGSTLDPLYPSLLSPLPGSVIQGGSLLTPLTPLDPLDPMAALLDPSLFLTQMPLAEPVAAPVAPAADVNANNPVLALVLGDVPDANALKAMEVTPENLENILTNGTKEQKLTILTALGQGVVETAKTGKPEDIFNAINNLVTVVQASKLNIGDADVIAALKPVTDIFGNKDVQQKLVDYLAGIMNGIAEGLSKVASSSKFTTGNDSLWSGSFLGLGKSELDKMQDAWNGQVRAFNLFAGLVGKADGKDFLSGLFGQINNIKTGVNDANKFQAAYTSMYGDSKNALMFICSLPALPFGGPAFVVGGMVSAGTIEAGTGGDAKSVTAAVLKGALSNLAGLGVLKVAGPALSKVLGETVGWLVAGGLSGSASSVTGAQTDAAIKHGRLLTWAEFQKAATDPLAIILGAIGGRFYGSARAKALNPPEMALPPNMVAQFKQPMTISQAFEELAKLKATGLPQYANLPDVALLKKLAETYKNVPGQVNGLAGFGAETFAFTMNGKVIKPYSADPFSGQYGRPQVPGVDAPSTVTKIIGPNGKPVYLVEQPTLTFNVTPAEYAAFLEKLKAKGLVPTDLRPDNFANQLGRTPDGKVVLADPSAVDLK